MTDLLFTGQPWDLRDACPRCGNKTGTITTKNGQDMVFCVCGTWVYNAPRAETGREQRSVRTRPDIKPSQRARIIERDSGQCVLCGSRRDIHVGHLLSVEQGRNDLTMAELFDDENLACMCSECNLGWSSRTLPLRLVIPILLARLHRENGR